MMVFARYSVGMGIRLDLDKTGAPALDPLTADLPFTCRLFHVTTFPTSSVARAMECLACRIKIMRFGFPGLRYPDFNSNCCLLVCKPLIEVGP
jgi:hypothetical protein